MNNQFELTELPLPTDGLPTTAAERWVRQKVTVISEYLSSFAGHLAGKVDDIIFVDLCAGNGVYSLGAKKDLFLSSALSALTLDVPFTKFVFCEYDPERAATLKIRVNRQFREKNVVILEGRPADVLDKLNLYVPPSKGNYRSATICLVDAFSLDVPFDVLSRLADAGYSFLIPFTFALSEQLNFEYYLVEERERLKRFLGAQSLDAIEKGLTSNAQFYKRLVRTYEHKLLSLGLNGASSVHKLDSGMMEIPLYCIGLFSRQVPTKFIQKDVDAAQHVQFELFDR